MLIDLIVLLVTVGLWIGLAVYECRQLREW